MYVCYSAMASKHIKVSFFRILDLPAVIISRSIFGYLDMGPGGSLVGQVSVYWDKLRYESCAHLIANSRWRSYNNAIDGFTVNMYLCKFPNITHLILKPALHQEEFEVTSIGYALTAILMFPFPLLESIETTSQSLRLEDVKTIRDRAPRLKSLHIVTTSYDPHSKTGKPNTSQLYRKDWFTGYEKIPPDISVLVSVTNETKEEEKVTIRVKPCSRCTKDVAFISTTNCPAGSKCKYKDIPICWTCTNHEFYTQEVGCSCEWGCDKIHNICTAVDTTAREPPWKQQCIRCIYP